MKALILVALLALGGCAAKDDLGNPIAPHDIPKTWTFDKVTVYHVEPMQLIVYCRSTFNYRVDMSADNTGCVKQWAAVVSNEPCYYAVLKGLPKWQEAQLTRWMNSICNGWR